MLRIGWSCSTRSDGGPSHSSVWDLLQGLIWPHTSDSRQWACCRGRLTGPPSLGWRADGRGLYVFQSWCRTNSSNVCSNRWPMRQNSGAERFWYQPGSTGPKSIINFIPQWIYCFWFLFLFLFLFFRFVRSFNRLLVRLCFVCFVICDLQF